MRINLFNIMARLRKGKALGIGTEHHHSYRVECRDRDGNIKWIEEVPNLVTTAGLTDIITKYYKGSGYTAAHYIGLAGGTPTFAAGDTMASHAGWTEVTDYSQSTRPAPTWGTPSAGSVDNSGSPASFSINGAATIGGAFLATNSTKGGTSGTLVGGAAFASDRTLSSGDTLTITVTATAS